MIEHPKVHSRQPLALASAMLSLVLLAVTGTPAGAQLATTDSQHYRAGPNDSAGRLPESSLRDFKGPRYRGRVLLRRRADLSRLGLPSQRLSRACREGRFRQHTDRRYVAVLDDRTYGAALGAGVGLYDPAGIAQAGLVYVFVGQGTTDCRVYVGGTPNTG